METVGTPLLWVGFTLGVLILLALDLGLFHRKAHAVGPREALAWTGVWIGLALAFNLFVFLRFGSQPAVEFLTAYLIEKALSVDNLFVFLVIFSYFAVPAELQHRVLFWGVLGALLMRALFIAAGAALIHNFHWVIYIFGAFLVFTAVKLVTGKEQQIQPEKNPVLRLFRRLVPSVPDYHGARFTVREAGRRLATPLLAVLVLVEATDVVFAVDSVPAIFAITEDPFIVYTSNIFAILGLRSLYFVLAGMMGRFHYLKIGLGLVLGFVGLKMLLSEIYKLPVGIALGVVVALIGGSILLSIVHPPPKKEPEAVPPSRGA